MAEVVVFFCDFSHRCSAVDSVVEGVAVGIVLLWWCPAVSSLRATNATNLGRVQLASRVLVKLNGERGSFRDPGVVVGGHASANASVGAQLCCGTPRCRNLSGFCPSLPCGDVLFVGFQDVILRAGFDVSTEVWGILQNLFYYC